MSRKERMEFMAYISGWIDFRSIESSFIIAGGKAAYVGIVVGRWADMVKVYRNPTDCSSFLTKIESKVIS